MWSELRYRLRAIFRRRSVEQELTDEIAFHLDREADERHRGEAPAQASRHARVDFGGIEQAKEACRDERGTGVIDRTAQDLRYAWRMFWRHPAFTFGVVGTLALGIGGATTMFGVVNGVLIKALPYPNSDRLVQIGRTFGSVRVSAASAVDFDTLAAGSATLSAVAIARTETVDVSGGELQPARLEAAAVSASYFDVLGVTPARGSGFLATDDRPGSRQAVVISDRMWRQRFNADAGVAIRTLTVNGAPHAIVGVMPRDFHGPEALGQDEVDLWLPLGRVTRSPDPDDAMFSMIAALKPDIDAGAVRSDLDRVSGRSHFWTTPLRDKTIGDAASGLWLLFGAVGLLLLIACANIANLFMVRASDRSREIAVRTAMGAGQGRIARQLVTETVVFSVAGGVLGVTIALGGLALVRAWAPAELPRVAELRLDAGVLAFAFVAATAAGLLFGVMPALIARRSDFAGILRASASSMTPGRSGVNQRSALVVIQTAIAVMLIAGAGLMANSVYRLSRVDPGFNPSNVVWMDISLPERGYTGAPPKIAFFDDLARRASSTPGILSIGVIQGRPLGGGNAVSTVAPEGRLPADGESPRVPFHVVSPGYFASLEIDRVDGRDFNADDRATSTRVAIVSRAFADRFWPSQRAVGKRFWMGRVAADAPLTEIVGVVEDVRQYQLADAPVPMVYRPFAQVPRGNATIVARHDGRSAAHVIDGLRAVAATLDSALPLDRAGTMDAQVLRSIRESRFRALALMMFAGLAAAIAAVGLYGTLAWVIRTRRKEIGVRLALGAGAGDLRSRLIGRGLALTAIGVAIGLTGAALGAKVLSSMLFGITHTDGPTFAAAGMMMLVIALVASYLPTRHISHISPTETLRD